MLRLVIGLFIFCLLHIDGIAEKDENLNLSIKAEGGSLKTQQTLHILGNGEIQLQYSKKISGLYFQSWGTLRPEMWSIEDESGAFKWTAGFSGLTVHNGLRIGGSISVNSAKYYNLNYNYAYQLSRFNGFLSGQLYKNLSWVLTGGYFYRDFDSIYPFETDGLNLSAKLEKYTTPGIRLSAQFNAVQFNIQARDRYLYDTKRPGNSGSQIGPQIAIRIGTTSIFNLSYGLYLHTSDIVEPGEILQQLTFAFITRLNPQWHFLLYANLSHFDFTLQNPEARWLLYYSTQKQNRIFGKLEKTLSASLSIYSRFGYTQEELIWETLELSGAQFIIGLQFKK